MIPDYAIRNLDLTTFGSEARFDRWADTWAKNFLLKMVKGKYREDLAIKGLRDNFVPEMIKFYRKEYGENYIGDYYLGRVSKEDKEKIAKEVVLPNIKDKIRWYKQNPHLLKEVHGFKKSWSKIPKSVSYV